ncbi:TRAP transporter large permease subunit [Paracoccus rhizosphaerae]|uniref:TRAP transporter large permease subunit n=1 Tax=Paracoccus rhizosphaerae TaxID=1133347 RepID=UPI003617E1D7
MPDLDIRAGQIHPEPDPPDAGNERLGLQPLQAHLFVFWIALLSTITPPVCGAVFVAAGMAQKNCCGSP